MKVTKEDIIKMFKKYSEDTVYFSKNTREFFTLPNGYQDKSTTFYLTETYGDGRWTFNCYLEPDDIILLGQFYKGDGENESN